MKICKTCEEEKPLIEFSRDKTRSDGLNYRCKTCMKVVRSKNYEKHKEKTKEKVKQYRVDNPEKRKESQRQSYHRHIEKNRAAKRAYRNKNKLILNEKRRDWWYADNDKACFLHAKARKIKEGYKGDILTIELQIYKLNRQIRNGISK